MLQDKRTGVNRMEIKVFKHFPNDAMKIRQEVFVEEQGFLDEFDEIDKVAMHIVAYDGNEAAGTCRVFYDEDKSTYVLGRLAVVKLYRGVNLGSLLLKEAEKQVLSNGGDRLILHSQCVATGFYRKNGYREYGNVEDDEGCPHIWMMKNLIVAKA